MLSEIHLLFGITLLLFLSAFFSASETALMSLSRTDVRRISGGTPAERAAFGLLKNTRKLLGAILVGNMFVNVLLASLFSSLLQGLFGASGGSGPFERLAMWLGPGFGEGFALRFGQACRGMANVLIVTPLLMVFGEQTPKVIAFSNGAAISRTVSRPLGVICAFLSPFSLVLRILCDVILRLCGQPAEGAWQEMTTEELLASISVSQETGATDDNEHRMLERIVGLGDIDVQEVMTHRVELVGVSDTMTLGEAFKFAREKRHSWYPVYSGSTDDIWGMLSLFEFMHWRGRPELDLRLSEFRVMLENGGLNAAAGRLPVSTPKFVPETAHIDKLLSDMRREAVSMVIVVDEYGGTSGIATQNDLIEEFIGRFADEEGEDEDAVHTRHDGSAVCDGRAHLRVLQKIFGDAFENEDGEADTIGGLIMERTEMIPRPGTSIELDDGTRVMVKRMSGRRVKQVIITPPDEDDEDEDGEGREDS